MRRRLPLRVQSACQEDWSAMQARGEGRHCARCESTVIDLTRATRSQAEAILCAHGGQVCGRVRGNERGEAMFAPEPVSTGLVPIALAGLLAACTAEPSANAAPPTELVADHEPAELASAAPVPATFGGSLATGVMMPIGPASSPEPTPTPVLVASVDPPITIDEPVEPTSEQRALTRRKHERRHPPTPPPYAHHWMGVMALPDP